MLFSWKISQRLIFNDLSKQKKKNIDVWYDLPSSSIVTNARNKIESLHYGLYLRTCLSQPRGCSRLRGPVCEIDSHLIHTAIVFLFCHAARICDQLSMNLMMLLRPFKVQSAYTDQQHIIAT